MAVNDFHVQIATAYPPLLEVPSRKGLTYRALIETDEGRKRAFLKLLSVEDIAREVLCATLARKLHLPIRPCYYVEVDPSLVCKNKFLNSDRVAFGLEEDVYPAFRGNSTQLEDEVLKWENALQCAIFDEWIFNRDRNAGNLVYVENGVFWLIDHDEALPNYASPSSSCGSVLLHKLAQDQQELHRHRLKQLALRFVQQIEEIDMAEVIELVRSEVLPPSRVYYQRYINFLTDRIPYLPAIITEGLGIKQREIRFDNVNPLLSKKTTKVDESEK